MPSSSSTDASRMALVAAATNKSRSDEDQSSPKSVMPAPMT
jgi:hypothetical protein